MFNDFEMWWSHRFKDIIDSDQPRIQIDAYKSIAWQSFIQGYKNCSKKNRLPLDDSPKVC